MGSQGEFDYNHKSSEAQRASSFRYQKWNQDEDEDFWVICAKFSQTMSSFQA